MNSYSRPEIVAYIPALHQGYLDLFAENKEANTLSIVDPTIFPELDHLRKDVRTIDVDDLIDAVQGLRRFIEIRKVDDHILQQIEASDHKLIMPDDEVTSYLESKYDLSERIEKYSPFLRWHRENFKTEIEFVPDSTVDVSELPTDVMKLLELERSESNDWFRRVGGVIQFEGLYPLDSAHNRNQYSDYNHYIDGDPSAAQSRGTKSDGSIFLHAEKSLIGRAAARGIPTKDANVFVTTFPCTNCSQTLAEAEISTLYYVDGYSSREGFDILKSREVRIIQIENFPTEELGSEFKPYPERS